MLGVGEMNIEITLRSAQESVCQSDELRVKKKSSTIPSIIDSINPSHTLARLED
jgi:hypothetical protein